MSLSIPIYIAVLIIVFALLIAAVLLIGARHIYCKTKQTLAAEADEQKQLLKDEEEKFKTELKEKYNAVGTLKPSDLREHLIRVFATCLEVESIRGVSERDMLSAERLYIAALAEMKQFLGNTTLNAIDRYYGTETMPDGSVLGYVDRWSLLAYRALEAHAVIALIIQKKTSSSEVIKQLEQYM